VVRQTFQLSRLQMHTHHFTLLIWTCVLTGLARPWLPQGAGKHCIICPGYPVLNVCVNNKVDNISVISLTRHLMLNL
jgi:hypothetical protein